jgi:hypothetical protein
MNICHQCGTQNEDGTVFCTGCGVQLGQGGGGLQQQPQVPVQQDYNVYGQPNDGGYNSGDGGKKKALVSMICGIASIPLGCCCPLFGIGGGAVGIVFGVMSKKEGTEGRRQNYGGNHMRRYRYCRGDC